MEKTSVKQKRQFYSGLLKVMNRKTLLTVSVLLAGAISFAKAPSSSEIKALTVEPDTEVFFTAQENGYTLKVPGVEPSMVQTDLPQLPAGVTYVSSKKEEYISSEGQRGTAVHLWFNFRETGPVRMPPLIVEVMGRTYYLAFGNATVYENPAVISPVMEVEFEKGVADNGTVDGVKRITARAGEEIIFTLKLKYFVQIIQFNWRLPKNSIFTELERYEITRGVPAGTGFSSEALPVARFSWKPLAEGTYTLPDIAVYATAYNGGRKTVSVPACVIKVLPEAAGNRTPSPLKEAGRKNSGVFDSAFTQRRQITSEYRGPTVTVEDCQKLARLRSRERHSFPGSSAVQERKRFENYLGLSNRAGEARKPVVISVIILTVIFAGLFVLFLLMGRVRFCIVMLIAACGMLVVSVAGVIELLPDYGIFCGGIISPVPENVTSSIHTYEGGLRVRISERAGDYYYIESSDVNGWVYCDLVYEVK